MKTLLTGDRFELGDVVSWLDVSGEELTGEVIDIVIRHRDSAQLVVKFDEVTRGRLKVRATVISPERVRKAHRQREGE